MEPNTDSIITTASDDQRPHASSGHLGLTETGLEALSTQKQSVVQREALPTS
jgi:hypothetical protein